MIRTKIVATMGPACSAVETLQRMFGAGVDVCRLNFSHGDLDAHARVLASIREAAETHEHPIGVLGDLCGPKIRLGQIADIDGTGGMPCNVGDQLIFQRQPIVGTDLRVSTTYAQFVDDVQVGHRVLIEDGLIRLLCTDKTADEIRCQCTVGGVIKSSKGINLPNTAVNVPSITDRDWACADWAIDNDLDFLALSFVRKADDIHLLRQHLTNRGSRIQIVAKIEKAEALDQIDAIVDAADALMIARGDLGVEMDVAQVPIIQKDLIRRCHVAAKPVIVATQMLQSMIEQASPTRAEVSDVANAIFDGTDAVMLSGETSVGKFPIGAVHTMAHVADETESYLNTIAPSSAPMIKLKTMQISAGVARGAWQMVQDLRPKVVVIWSQTGMTARIFSKTRFPIPIVAISSDERALRQMSLLYGVIAQQLPTPSRMVRLIEEVDGLMEQRKFAKTGERVLLVAGSSFGGTPGTMNSVIVHAVGEHWQMIPQTPAAAGAVESVGMESA
jgi:pyruvate kinase